MISNSEFSARLSTLVAQKVRNVNVGGSTGSIFVLHLCDPKDPEHGEAIDQESGHNIMVKCSWRLDDTKNSRPITGWQEDSDMQGVMTRRLKSVINDIVTRIEISAFSDLEVYFSSGKRLFVFCDLTPYVEADFNWSLGTSEGTYAIRPDLKCTYESSRSSDHMRS